jgi:hypothetical protein
MDMSDRLAIFAPPDRSTVRCSGARCGTKLSSETKVLADIGYQRLRRQMRSRLGQHPPDMHRNELVKFSKLVEQFFNEIKECALVSQRALTDLVRSGLDNVGALAH